MKSGKSQDFPLFVLSDGLSAYLVARWSVLNTFEAAILRDFGEREDFERVLTHALRRGCGGRVLLSLMADGSLRLTGTRTPTSRSARCCST